ncbi:MAG: hypothetical protein DLM62_18495 [Pseudonocardiales bacterium]|nr:MAG: hypothetical protein DLM62_18495 [Pseudonocardiales bacterium]
MAGLLGALVAAALTLLIATVSSHNHRAQMELAMLPSSVLTPQEVPSFWEALNQGQVTRTAVEVFGQRRWVPAAAAAAGVPASSLALDAGVVPNTTLMRVTMEAGSALAAERALTAAVQQALPLAQQVSGPFTILAIQGAEGTAVPVGPPVRQLVIVLAAGGFLVGAGIASLVMGRSTVAPAAQSRKAPAGPSATADQPRGPVTGSPSTPS